MRTWLTERFALEIPVVCAPMAGVAGGQLAAAVSSAGGLGMVGVGDRTTAAWIEAECRIARATGRAFGIGLQAWAVPLNPGQVEAALSSGASLVSLSYGDYAPLVDQFRSSGMVVATAVGNVNEARKAQASGIDLIIARGCEGGGHGRNDVGTLTLLQTVLDAVSTPVIAAGGIGSARGLAAVLAAGAVGAWVGTAFTASTESTTTPNARQRLMAAQDTDTVYTTIFDTASGARWPREFGERALRNEFHGIWEGRDEELSASPDALRTMELARLRDDVDITCVDAGQGVGMLTSELPAIDILKEFARASDLLRTAAAGH